MIYEKYVSHRGLQFPDETKQNQNQYDEHSTMDKAGYMSLQLVDKLTDEIL